MDIRRLARWVNAATVKYPSAIEEYAHDDRATLRAASVVPYLYFFLLFTAFSATVQWLSRPPFSAALFEPRMTIPWAGYIAFDTAVLIECGLFLLGSCAGSFFFNRRWARALAFFGLFQYHAFMSSFGAPEHNLLVYVYPLLFCIFLPDLWTAKETTVLERKKFLVGFVGIQVYVGLIYSLAGLSKIVRGTQDLLHGNANFLAPDAFALHIANWLSSTGGESLLGPFIVAHPYLGWPFFLGMLYFQLFTLVAVFRPALHWIWGVFLISFYILNYLTMNIFYIDTFFLIAALFLNSPFERGFSWRERISVMPLFGLLFRFIR